MKKTIINKIIILLIVLEIVLSFYLIYLDKTKVSNICMLGTSCESVRDSVYGQLFGIKLPYYSIAAFAALLVLFLANKKLFLIGSSIGGIISLYLIVVQIFVLKQICVNCMIIDITMIFIVILGILKKYGRI